jgi:serine/threonine protein phosphatase PrpC
MIWKRTALPGLLPLGGSPDDWIRLFGNREVFMEVKIACLSNCGGKEVNDDTVSVLQEKGDYVFVGDGLGGYAGGQQASRIAAKEIMKAAAQNSLINADSMFQAAELADQAVRQLQRETGQRMKTTVVFLAIENDIARWMHVGDSRLYCFREGKLNQQTMDHSVSQLAVLMGEITLPQIRFHEDRNRVLRALGAENAKADISQEWKILLGDVFLLCTDGFWEYICE